MSLNTITGIMQSGIFLVFKLCAPVLGGALIIGLVVAIFQATTSIQESTLTFLPKLAVILLVLALLGGWMFTELRTYMINLYDLIPQMAKMGR